MISKINTCSIVGTTAALVMVETDVHSGLPDFKIVGASSVDVRDARDRVRVGIENAGFMLPPKRITVSLVPAPLKKNGTSFDVAIAVSVLSSFGFFHNEKISEYMFLGEVALDGSLREVKGLLFSILFGMSQGINRFIVPSGNLPECSLIKDAEILGFDNLFDLVVFLNGDSSGAKLPEKMKEVSLEFPVFSDIVGEKAGKIAITAALAGGHRLLILGGGQEHRRELIKRASSIVEAEYSDIVEKAAYRGIREIPDICDPDIMGVPVYFFKGLKDYQAKLAEIGSFTGCLNVMEDTEAFDEMKVDFYSFYRCKCKAENPKNCICSPKQIKDRQGLIKKIMDERSDIVIEPGDREDISDFQLKALYHRAKALQNERYKNTKYKKNADIPDRDTKKIGLLEDAAEVFFKAYLVDGAIEEAEGLRLIRLSRTLADMEGEENILLRHIKYAIKLRGKHD